MGAGKILMILAGLITIVSTYLLSFYELLPGIYGWGVGAILFIDEAFTSGDAVVVVVEILIVIFLISGILQFIGAKIRAIGFIGSLFVLGMFVYFMLIEFQLISSTAIYALLFAGEAIGPIPLHVSVGSFAGLGVYLLAGGAVLGLIGTFVGRD